MTGNFMNHIVYKFPLYPSILQQKILWDWSRALNTLFNHFLDVQKTRIVNKQAVLRRFDTHNMIPELKFKIQNLDCVYSEARQACSDRIATLMILWQRKHISFPKFRSGYTFFNIVYSNFEHSCKLTNSYFIGGKLCKSYPVTFEKSVNNDILC